jgi:hypothetical protein
MLHQAEIGLTLVSAEADGDRVGEDCHEVETFGKSSV